TPTLKCHWASCCSVNNHGTRKDALCSKRQRQPVIQPQRKCSKSSVRPRLERTPPDRQGHESAPFVRSVQLKNTISFPAASLSPSRILRPPSGNAVRSHCWLHRDSGTPGPSRVQVS